MSLENNTFPAGLIGVKLIPKSEYSGVSDSNSDKEDQNGNNGVSIDGQGGPDLFGYKWIDSNDPNGPVYVWQDIVSTGTLATNWIATGTFDAKDEGYAGPFAIGFDFNFYGNTKTQVYVSSNGLLVFNTLSSEHIYECRHTEQLNT